MAKRTTWELCKLINHLSMKFYNNSRSFLETQNKWLHIKYHGMKTLLFLITTATGGVWYSVLLGCKLKYNKGPKITQKSSKTDQNPRPVSLECFKRVKPSGEVLTELLNLKLLIPSKILLFKSWESHTYLPLPAMGSYA